MSNLTAGDELHWGEEIHLLTNYKEIKMGVSGDGPIHACVPIHAHPQLSQRFIFFQRKQVYHIIENYQTDPVHW